jgi:hypothetical protein
VVADVEKMIALATINRGYTRPGTNLQFEITVEAVRHHVRATVVKTPFFNPKRKTQRRRLGVMTIVDDYDPNLHSTMRRPSLLVVRRQRSLRSRAQIRVLQSWQLAARVDQVRSRAVRHDGCRGEPIVDRARN